MAMNLKQGLLFASGGFALAIMVIVAVGWLAQTQRANHQAQREAEVGLSGAQRALPDQPAQFSLDRSLPDVEALRRLLFERRYDELEQALEVYRQDFLRDISRERPLFLAYEAFDQADYKLKARLEAWVAHNRVSASAHSALARCLMTMGWDSRGGKFKNETAPQQFDEMTELFRAAEQSAITALEIEPRQPIAYGVLLRMLKSGATRDQALPLDGLKLFPASYTLWELHLQGMQPKWGGSLEQIAAAAQQAQAHSALNPRLAVLLGYADWARAVALYDAEQYEQAYPSAEQALRHGLSDSYLDTQRRLALKTGRHAAALASARQLDEQFPRHDEQRVAQTLRALDQLGRAAHQQRRMQEALSVYDLVLAEPGDHGDLRYWRGKAHEQLGHRDQALEDFRQMLVQDPAHYNAVWNLDRILSAQQRYEEVIPYWDAYIAREPDKGEAYMERGGSYYRLGRLREAGENARKACELGVTQGCEWAARVGGS